MAEKIDGYGKAGLDVSPSRTRQIARAERQSDVGATQTPRAAGDAVELTDTAARLKRIEARLADVPDVDRARVDALRQRIESGQYEMDPARIAGKLLRLEQDLS